jgi:hypothetical protein
MHQVIEGMRKVPPMKIFETIYRRGFWGNGSGPGSDLRGLGPYSTFLEKLLRDKKPKRVVDLGCGCFEPYAELDWLGCNYIGIDVTKHCISRNAIYSGPTRSFKVGDWCNMEELPEADIAICKDVLQHWSHADVCKGLLKLCKYPCCVITNSIKLGTRRLNGDIFTGDVRPLNLLAPPYLIRASICQTYNVVTNPVLDEKQIIVWEPRLHPLNPTTQALITRITTVAGR